MREKRQRNPSGRVRNRQTAAEQKKEGAKIIRREREKNERRTIERER